MNEVWKSISGYEGIYEVSSLGNIKSLSRLVKCKSGKYRLTLEKLLKYKVNKKRVYLGSFNNEIDAHNAYQNRLKQIK